MKFSTAILLLASVTGASAFAPIHPLSRATTTTTTLRMSYEEESSPATMRLESVAETPAVPKPFAPKMSQSLPWMPRPSALDGTLAGDVGFDPIGFAKSKDDLMNYREAEIKHARLAMLVR